MGLCPRLARVAGGLGAIVGELAGHAGDLGARRSNSGSQNPGLPGGSGSRGRRPRPTAGQTGQLPGGSLGVRRKAT